MTNTALKMDRSYLETKNDRDQKREQIISLQTSALKMINDSNKVEVKPLTRSVLSTINAFSNDNLSVKIGISLAVDKTGRKIVIK